MYIYTVCVCVKYILPETKRQLEWRSNFIFEFRLWVSYTSFEVTFFS